MGQVIALWNYFQSMLWGYIKYSCKINLQVDKHSFKSLVCDLAKNQRQNMRQCGTKSRESNNTGKWHKNYRRGGKTDRRIFMENDNWKRMLRCCHRLFEHTMWQTSILQQKKIIFCKALQFYGGKKKGTHKGHKSVLN